MDCFNSSGHNGFLSRILVNGQESEKYQYDGYGRLTQSNQVVYGHTTKTFAFQYGYDNLGRVSKLIYPGGYELNYTYDTYGYNNYISDNKNSFSWSSPLYNDLGQPTQHTLGNGVVVTNSYDSHFMPDVIAATKGTNKVMNWDFNFGTDGNLASRIDLANASQVETFGYDALSRLTSSSAGPGVTYGANYNIATKSDAGAYSYTQTNGSSLHALTQLNSYAGYNPPSHSVTYNHFQKIQTINTTINGQSSQADFTYDINRSRSIMQVKKNGSVSYTKYYAGKLYEERVDANGSTTAYNYVYLDGKIAGLYIDKPSGVADEGYYVHTDYLGSVVALSNQAGSVIEKYAYDAWGKRRNPDNWSQADTRETLITDRGFTGHEHMDAFALINMGGRMYDPAVGMFLSPDPALQSPGNPLNYNRYSYCWNNPLKYTDPSGYYNQDPLPLPKKESREGGSGSSSGDGWSRAMLYPGQRWDNLVAGAMGSISYNYSSGQYADKRGDIHTELEALSQVKGIFPSQVVSPKVQPSLINSVINYANAVKSNVERLQISFGTKDMVICLSVQNGMYNISFTYSAFDNVGLNSPQSEGSKTNLDGYFSGIDISTEAALALNSLNAKELKNLQNILEQNHNINSIRINNTLLKVTRNAKIIDGIGIVGNVADLGTVGLDIYNQGGKVTAENVTDGLAACVSFIRPYGWVVSSIYTLNKAASKTGYYFSGDIIMFDLY